MLLSIPHHKWFRPRLGFHSPLRRQTTLKFAGDTIFSSTVFNGLIIYLPVKSLSNSALVTWLLRYTFHCGHLNTRYRSMVLLAVRVFWLSGSLLLLKAWRVYKGSLTNPPSFLLDIYPLYKSHSIWPALQCTIIVTESHSELCKGTGLTHIKSLIQSPPRTELWLIGLRGTDAVLQQGLPRIQLLSLVQPSWATEFS